TTKWAKLLDLGARLLALGCRKTEPSHDHLDGILAAGQHELLSALLASLERDCIAKIIDRRQLETLSGQEGSSTVLLEQVVPLPPRTRGSISVQFEDYTLRLNLTPTALGDGRIRLRAEGERQVPSGSTERRTKTETVELEAGQSLLLGVGRDVVVITPRFVT